MKKLALILSLSIGLSSLEASAQAANTDTKSQFSIADSSSFTGKYKYEGLPFEHIEVSVREGKLYFVGGEYQGFLEPLKDKKDAFDVDGKATFTFVRNSESKVSELKVEYEGETYQGKKEKISG